MALDMENTGRIISCDLHANKLSLIENGATKLGISIIETREQNSGVFVPELEDAADRVLCDVPCSGLGIMRKKPDIRSKCEDEIVRLPEIQYKILENCSRYIKPGGILVYSTCTLRKSENENITDQFVSTHPDFEYTEPDGKRTFFPFEDGIDGFYIAKIRKKV